MLLDGVVESLRAWFDKRTGGDGKSGSVWVYMILALGVAVAVVGSVVQRSTTMEQIPIILGSFGGVILLVGLYGLWYVVFPADLHDKFNLRDNLSLSNRRKVAAVIVLAWLLVAITLGKYTGGPVMGALAVVAFISAWRLASMKPEEVDAINEALEREETEWEAAYRAEREAQGFTSDGYEIDEEDLPPRPSPLKRFIKGD